MLAAGQHGLIHAEVIRSDMARIKVATCPEVSCKVMKSAS